MMSPGRKGLEGKRIWVAGHRGLVGSALVRRLAAADCEVLSARRKTVDLRRQKDVETWLGAARPEVVFLAAGHVGGILANSTYPAEFLYDNIMIAANVIEAARRVGVERLVYLGSSCIYPKFADQPIAESALLTGPLEPTNQWYAIAKIAGVKLVQSYRRQYGLRYISAQPTNLYGPGDNFDLDDAHVLPALMRKAHEAKVAGKGEMEVWGSGTPLREFMHVDDLADALVFLAERYDDDEIINVGTGEELSVRTLTEAICDVVGFTGRIVFDDSKPDGTPRKALDVSSLKALGWRHAIPLRTGLEETYRWFLQNLDGLRGASRSSPTAASR